MTDKIMAPGIVADMSAADYHADPCPAPSLSQSLAKRILNRSPLHAWMAHPRLNPNYEPDDPTKYDIGNIAHRLLINRGKELAVIDAPDWRTKAAKEARVDAAGDGKLGVLQRDFDIATEMVEAARQQLFERDLNVHWSPENGSGEVVLAWPENGIWLRCMIDWLTTGRDLVFDYKTTGASAAPIAISRKMADDGWDVQAAMHERGLNALHPESAGRRKHLFVCQENDPPYALTVAQLPESTIEMGRRKISVAIGLWTECMADDVWPGYPAETFIPEYPEFAERRWLDREVSEFAGVIADFYKPLKLGARP